MISLIKFITRIPKMMASGAVWVYIYCISPMLPHVCRFTPSCAVYAVEAISSFGFFKGVWLGIKRVFRCNPKTKGGLDSVPYNLKGDYKWVM